MSKNKVCIVLPCFRVKHKIYTVYKKLISQKIDCLIFVDDNCPQKSVKYLKSRISTNKKVQFIFLRKNLGVGGATLKGFKSAYNQGFDLLIKFDADNQHKILDLMNIIKKLNQENILFCTGYRNLNFKDSFKRGMPLIRILGANVLTFISNITPKFTIYPSLIVTVSVNILKFSKYFFILVVNVTGKLSFVKVVIIFGLPTNCFLLLYPNK